MEKDRALDRINRIGRIDRIRNWSRSEKKHSRFPIPKDLRWISTGS